MFRAVSGAAQADLKAFEPTIYAVDFGTSNSLLVGANRDAVSAPVPVDPSADDPSILRSILYFPERSGEAPMLFGEQALESYAEAGMQGRLLRSLKRFLPDAAFLGTAVGPRRYRLEELISALLRTLRLRADEAFGREVKHVLLGRPARYSNDAELDKLAESRMREAALLAGFEQVEFFAEPIAAARDVELDLAEPRLVFIADLGGGTSDFSVVRMDGRGFAPSDVLATHGLSVAGDALDGALMQKELSWHFGADVQYRVAFGKNSLSMPQVLIDMLCTPAKLPLLQAREVQNFLKEIRSGAVSEDDRARAERLLVVAEDAQGFSIFESVERVKRELSQVEHAEFAYDYADIEIRQALSREQFEKACRVPIRNVFEAVDETLNIAQLRPEQIDWVCLTGGTSRVPAVAVQLEQRFGKDKLRRLKSLHSVAQGLGQEAQRRAASV